MGSKTVLVNESRGTVIMKFRIVVTSRERDWRMDSFNLTNFGVVSIVFFVQRA